MPPRRPKQAETAENESEEGATLEKNSEAESKLCALVEELDVEGEFNFLKLH